MFEKSTEDGVSFDHEYEFSTSCTRDEAAKYLMGWSREDLIANQPPEDASPEEIELCDFSLQTLLNLDWENAACYYENAKFENLSEAIVVERLKKLEWCKSKLERAHRFFCSIDDELSKGDKSELRVDRLTTKSPQFPYITLASLEQWAIKNYKIDIFKSGSIQPNIEGIDSRQEVKKKPAEGGLTAEAAKPYFEVFILLIRVFMGFGNKYRRDEGIPNCSAITKEILIQMGKIELPGQSKRTIEDLIKSTLKSQNNAGKPLSPTLATNLQITIALFVETIANIKPDLKLLDLKGNPDVIKLIKCLTILSDERPYLSEEDMRNLIYSVLAVKREVIY